MHQRYRAVQRLIPVKYKDSQLYSGIYQYIFYLLCHDYFISMDSAFSHPEGLSPSPSVLGKTY